MRQNKNLTFGYPTPTRKVYLVELPVCSNPNRNKPIHAERQDYDLSHMVEAEEVSLESHLCWIKEGCRDNQQKCFVCVRLRSTERKWLKHKVAASPFGSDLRTRLRVTSTFPLRNPGPIDSEALPLPTHRGPESSPPA